MRFAHPEAFWLLGLLPILVVLFWIGKRRKETFLWELGDLVPQSQTASRFPRLHKPWVQALFLLCAFLNIILALADPRFPYGTPRLRAGVLDVVFVIDVSKSMAAEDYGSLSRLEKAGEVARELLTALQGNRVGIVTFAGTSFRQAELTEDLQALDFILKHWLQIDAVGVGGSNIGRAIETGIALFPEDPSRGKLLFLFSDGGEQENLEEVLTKATHRGIRIVTLGLGSLQPSKIPLYNAQKKFTGYLKVNEQVVTTRLNEENLQQIATATQGMYQRIVSGAQWHHLLTQPAVVGNTLTQEEQKLFQIFLLFGLLALCAQVLIARL
jgi:Ca-activated chloride channel family protein